MNRRSYARDVPISMERMTNQTGRAPQRLPEQYGKGSPSRPVIRSQKVTRSEVLKAALALFSSQGYAETKMVDIANASGLSVGALYLRFRSKEDLCLALIKDQTDDFQRAADTVDIDEPLRSLRDYIAFNLEYAFQRRQLLSMFIREHRLPFLQPLRKDFYDTQIRLIRKILLAGRKKGVFSAAKPSQTASVIFATIRGVILLKVIFGIGEAKTLSNELFCLVTQGLIRRPKGKGRQ